MERYRSLGPIYYRDAVAAIIVYDQGDQQSADALRKWLGAFRQTVNGQAYIAIAANKDDREEKTVDPEPIRQWATENHFEFFITSAKTGKGIDELFQSLVKHLLVNTSADPADPKAAPPLIQDGGPAGARAVCC
jgi:GTPase SAR1 family protein